MIGGRTTPVGPDDDPVAINSSPPIEEVAVLAGDTIGDAAEAELWPLLLPIGDDEDDDDSGNAPVGAVTRSGDDDGWLDVAAAAAEALLLLANAVDVAASVCEDEELGEVEGFANRTPSY